MNKTLKRAFSLLITAAMLASSVPGVLAEDPAAPAAAPEAVGTAADTTETAPAAEADEAPATEETAAAEPEAETATEAAVEEKAEIIEDAPVEIMADKNSTADEKLEFAVNQLAKLNFRETKAKTVTSSIHLPTVVVTEENVELGTISWETSDGEKMANDGTVYMQPAPGEDPYRVTLTAHITCDGVTMDKEYEVAILHATDAKAFPGAQGYGTQTRGGAGGYVYHVTSLGADGPGTFKYALETMSGPRTIVFDVGGTIDLTSVGRALKISGDDDDHLTIAGQTAPGEGIQLKGYGFAISNVDDLIIRNISIRIGNVRKYGDTYQSDPMSVSGVNRVVLDHVSMCWAVDMAFRVYGTEVTMSNCMASKGLYWNTPHEKGRHNYAGMFGPKYGSFYGNYIADCGQRAPRINDNEYVDVRNNVVFNSKYSFDICNYEWMGANPKFNIINNVVLKGNSAPGNSTSNQTSSGSYKYFQGRTYSGGLFTYSINNYDNTKGARAIDKNDKEITGGLWQGELDSKDEKASVEKEMGAFAPGGYSNITREWYDMIFPSDISLKEYNESLTSKQGNTLMNYPFVAPSMKTYCGDETVKYVLSNAGAKAPVRDILNTRYLAEARTRMQILSDFSKASKTYGIEISKDYEGETAYGLPIEVHTTYTDKNDMTVYGVAKNGETTYYSASGDVIADAKPEEYTEKSRFKFVSCKNHLDSIYATDNNGNKYLVKLSDYKLDDEDFDDSEGIYDAFEVYDINNTKLTRPSGDYATIESLDFSLNGKTVTLKFADWGDGPGNYDHANNPSGDGTIDPSLEDTEWSQEDWPQLPTVYRNGKFDSNGDGIPDFFIKLMGWDQHPDYRANKDISRLDFEGRGYTNLEYYINDYCASDQELEDSEETVPVPAENVRDGSSKYNTHKSHEILFNTVRRAKAKVYYNEGTEFDESAAKEVNLNSVYDVNSSRYTAATDFETYFSAILSDLKAGTTYSYKIKTYSDTGIESLTEETYHFTTNDESSGKPAQPRITKCTPFDNQITLNFEPGSANKSYKQDSFTFNSQTRYLTYISNNVYDEKTDHYTMVIAKDKDFKEIVRTVENIPVSLSSYTIHNYADDTRKTLLPESQQIKNNTDYYIDFRAVSGDGTKSDPAVYNQKKLEVQDGAFDKDGNPIYYVKGIEVSGNTEVAEYPTENDVSFAETPIQPSKYVVNADYARDLKKYNVTQGETSKFITVFGDVEDWYIYTLGGIPIPSNVDLHDEPIYGDSEHDPILLLRDDNHDHGFTYAKKFSTPLSGKSTIHAKFMIKDEELDPMNQAPEFRFYLQQDSAESDADTSDEGESGVDNGSNDASAFGNIVTLQFTKNDILYCGDKISRYTDGEWYDVKLLLDADLGTCSLYINDSLVGKDLEYSEAATSHNIARWQISSRLAGTEDVFVEYMYAYSGWDDPNPDPDATPAPSTDVQEGTSGNRPSSGGGGGGGGGTGAVTVRPTATPDPNATPNPTETETPEPVATLTPGATPDPEIYGKSMFKDMDGYEWANVAVNVLHEKEIVFGITDDIFAPGRDITRAEFLTLLMRGYDLIRNDAKCDFADVPSGSWYYPAVSVAYSMGVVNGFSDEYFGANEKVSRQDMAVMIVRLLDKLDKKLPGARTYSDFADEASISEYAKASVKALYEAGIIDGVGDNRFDPQGTTNRAAAAKVLYGTLLPDLTTIGEEEK